MLMRSMKSSNHDINHAVKLSLTFRQPL